MASQSSGAPAAGRPYRRGVSAMQLLRQRITQRQRPTSAMLEVADRCNESCTHCYQVQGQKGELTTQQLFRVMDELRSLGVLFLTLSGGEPTLRRDFLQLVQYARSQKFAVKIYTNGLRIDEKMAGQLSRLAVQEVQISLYSPKATVHDRITRVAGSFERTVAAVRHLRKAGVFVVIKSPVMAENVDDTPLYLSLAEALGAAFALDPQLSPREDGSLAPLEHGIDPERALRLHQLPALRPAEKALRQAAPAKPLNDSPCGACAGNVHMEANGELRPCAQWKVAVGDAVSEGVSSAWENNPSARAIRQLTWNQLYACRLCDLRHDCSRCYSDAQTHTGDALAPYRQACERAAMAYALRTGVRPRLGSSRSSTSSVNREGTDKSLALVGPFVRTAEHQFEPAAASRTPEDERLLTQLPFLTDRGSGQGSQHSERFAPLPSGLVPLRLSR